MAAHSRVSNEALEEKRLDAEYYSKEYVVNAEKIQNFGACCSLESIRKDSIPIRRGIDMPVLVEDKTAPVLVTIASFIDPGVEFFDLKNISYEQHEKFHGSQVQAGDLLVAMGGYAGRAAIFPEKAPKANIGRHTARVVIDGEKADKYYIWAFIRSQIGMKQFERYITGSVQAGINLEDLREIKIVSPLCLAQKYIGNKVRQAERLRAWARKCELYCNNRLLKRFKYKKIESMRKRPRKVCKELLTTISLNPEYSEGTEGQNTFEKAAPLSSMIKTCKCGEPIKSEDRIKGEYPYYGASGPIDSHNKFNFDGTYLIVAQDGSIGFASVVRGKFWANNHVWIVEVKSEYNIDSIAYFLNNHFPYWKGVTTGSVVPKVTAENLLRIKVPLDIAFDFDSGNQLINSNLGRVQSNKLISAAKLLVEGLIERKVTEQDLIHAQQALDKGDNSLDRNILSRLTTTGIDDDGAPLFPDLDQLYQLLEQSNNPDSEV